MPTQPLPRYAAATLAATMAHMPAVAVVGPRQAGKTTLVRNWVEKNKAKGWRYETLDDAAVREAARADPAGFVRGARYLAIDEIQRAPDLLIAIKAAIDEDRFAGRFLVTGSSDFRANRRVKESLAGRIATVTLLPLSQAEIERARVPRFLDAVMAGEPPPKVKAQSFGDLPKRIALGGYPDAVNRRKLPERRAWLRAYRDAVVEQDLPDIGELQRAQDVPRLLTAAAAMSGKLLNAESMGNDLRMSRGTVERYLGFLEQVWLLNRIPAWSENALSRAVKAPKLHFYDSGVLSATLGMDENSLVADRSKIGPILESFVYGELAKLAALREDRVGIFHYRDRDAQEIDFIMESEGGGVAAIKVKASATVRVGDFAMLTKFRDKTSRAFAAGIVMYDGDKVLSFGDRLWAAPMSSLWT